MCSWLTGHWCMVTSVLPISWWTFCSTLLHKPPDCTLNNIWKCFLRCGFCSKFFYPSLWQAVQSQQIIPLSFSFLFFFGAGIDFLDLALPFASGLFKFKYSWHLSRRKYEINFSLSFQSHSKDPLLFWQL